MYMCSSPHAYKHTTTSKESHVEVHTAHIHTFVYHHYKIYYVCLFFYALLVYYVCMYALRILVWTVRCIYT